MTVIVPTDAEILATVKASGEHDSSPENEGPITGRRCAACGIFEADAGDYNYDGTHVVAVFSDELRECVDCTDCLVHRECARDGRCPHCNAIETQLADARALMTICDGDLSLPAALGMIAAGDRRAQGEPE